MFDPSPEEVELVVLENAKMAAIARWDVRAAVRLQDEWFQALGAVQLTRRTSTQEPEGGEAQTSPGERKQSGVSVFASPVDLDWNRDGDRLMRALHFGQLLSGTSMTFSYGGTTDDGLSILAGVEYHDLPLQTTLIILQAESGLMFRLIGPNGVPEIDLDEWRSTLEAALREIAVPTPHNAWYAILGPTQELFPNHVNVLVNRSSVGGLTFGPIDCWAADPKGGSFADGRAVDAYQPVAVSGVSKVLHDGPMYAFEEGVAIRRLCSLLSLLSDCGWEMKAPPQDLDIGLCGEDKAASTFFQELLMERMSKTMKPGSDPVSAPQGWTKRQQSFHASKKWLESAWKVLDADAPLGDILFTFHEARLLEFEHPSVAMSLYVATLDALGSRLGVTGSGRRVRAALYAGTSPAQANDLQRAYAMRNLTLHEGVLHGMEGSYGAYVDSYSGGRVTDFDFRHNVLRQSRLVCRRLLRRATWGRLALDRKLRAGF